VVRGGAVIDDGARDPSSEGIRRFAARLAAEPRVDATAIQTVGAKGHDGFVLALVCD
jgi:predicted O-methyltransferase YrrM